MKFIASSGLLLKNLQSVSGIISTNPAMPVVENFKFDIEQNKLKITATDLETTMSVEMDVQSMETASICVEAKMLMDFLKNLGEQPLTFDVNLQDYKVDFTSDEGNYSIPGENADQYPKEPLPENATEFSLQSSRLITAISNTVFAVSNDELRPAMTGVYFEMSKTHITFVATDAHRLVRYMLTDTACPEEHSLIVPKKPLNQLKGILANDDKQVSISYNNEMLFVNNGKVKLCCRLIDGKFPDYKMVIPSNNPYLLTVNRAEFLSALRRVSVFANKSTKQLILKISGSELRLFAQDVDFAHEGKERMACQYQGEDMDIAFNAGLFLELINALHSEEICIELSTPSRAGIIKTTEPVDGEDILMLIMPLMINS
jgi:DNA polymerase III subunit beta